jgi:ribosome-binding factor A
MAHRVRPGAVHFALANRAAIDHRAVRRALERASPFLRARLAKAIEMKRVPDLGFVFDGWASDDDDR